MYEIIAALREGYYSYPNRCTQAKKPTAQTAHLVFADTKANAE